MDAGGAWCLCEHTVYAQEYMGQNPSVFNGCDSVGAKL